MMACCAGQMARCCSSMSSARLAVREGESLSTLCGIRSIASAVAVEGWWEPLIALASACGVGKFLAVC